MFFCLRKLHTKHKSVDKVNDFLLKKDKKVQVFASFYKNKVYSEAPGFRVACF